MASGVWIRQEELQMVLIHVAHQLQQQTLTTMTDVITVHVHLSLWHNWQMQHSFTVTSVFMQFACLNYFCFCYSDRNEFHINNFISYTLIISVISACNFCHPWPLQREVQLSELVDSLCRNGADSQHMQYLKQKPYNFTTNMLNAYLSPQPSSLSAFMIIKTHTAAQKSHGRQLAKCACGNECAIFLILSFFLLRSTSITQDWFKYSPWFQHKTASYLSVQIHEHLASSLS